jgi:hypothetical protein
VIKDDRPIVFTVYSLWPDTLIPAFSLVSRPCHVYRQVINHKNRIQPHRVSLVKVLSTAFVKKDVAVVASLVCDKDDDFWSGIEDTLWWYEKLYHQYFSDKTRLDISDNQLFWQTAFRTLDCVTLHFIDTAQTDSSYPMHPLVVVHRLGNTLHFEPDKLRVAYVCHCSYVFILNLKQPPNFSSLTHFKSFERHIWTNPKFGFDILIDLKFRVHSSINLLTWKRTWPSQGVMFAGHNHCMALY